MTSLKQITKWVLVPRLNTGEVSCVASSLKSYWPGYRLMEDKQKVNRNDVERIT